MGLIHKRGAFEDDIHEAKLQLDLHGQITAVNSRACELLNRTSDELVNSRIQGTLKFFLNNRPVADLIARIAFDNNWMQTGVASCMTRTGNRFTLTSDSGPVFGTEGVVSGTILCFREPLPKTTSGSHVPVNSVNSEFLSQTNIGAWVWNVSTGALSINSYLGSLLGLTSEQCSNLTIDVWHSLCHPADVERSHHQVQMAFAGDIDHYEIELRLKTPGGNWLWVVNRGFVSKRADNGNVTEMSGVFLDRSRLKKTERELSDSERRYQDIFENSTAIKLLTDPQTGRIIEANTAASQFYGYTPTEIRQLHVWDINTLTQEETLRCLAKTSNREVQNFDFKHRLSNGELRDVHVFAGPIQMDDRVLVHSIIVDVTDQVLAQHSLRRMQQIESLGTLAGGIAHDFNNVLTAIFANLSVAKLSLEADNPALEFLQDATDSIQRAKGLSNQLLTFAKGGSPCRELLDINKLIRSVVLFDLSGSSVKPAFDIPDTLWPVQADSSQLQQVFSNLTINARHAMPNGGLIHVSATNCEMTDDPTLDDGPYVRICVQDNGCGIEEKDIERIFEPYYTTRNSGSGLGLATSFSIIKKHEGTIDVHSSVGVGTSFVVHLPAAVERLVPSSEFQCAGDSHIETGGRALVMDDEPAILKAIEAMLNKMNIQMVGCQNSEETLAAYLTSLESANPFDFVLLDLTIPGGPGGLDVSRKLREIDPASKLICTSGYAAHPVMHDYCVHGFQAAIPKPYLFPDLRKVVYDVIKSPAP